MLLFNPSLPNYHYTDFIMSAMASQFTRRLDCLLSCLFSRISKKTSKLRATGFCEGNPRVTGGFPSQMANNAENVSIWWRHHVRRKFPFSIPSRHWDGEGTWLTHLPLDKMTAISHTTLSSAFSWMKRFVFLFEFHWSLILKVQLPEIIWTNAGPVYWRMRITGENWNNKIFIQIEQYTLRINHNQWWLVYWRMYGLLGPSE